MDVETDVYKKWSPAAQAKALEALRERANDAWRPFYCPKPSCDGKPHDEWGWNHARTDQHPPSGVDWVVWLLLSGRGSGKTRTGAEYTHRMTEVTGRMAFVAATGPDARDIMIEGESGLLAVAPPGLRPTYEPSKRRLTWPNGCRGTAFSAEEPDRLRGPQHGYAWVDEPAHFALVQETWDNLMFGLRLGRRPRVVATTTPKPRPWLKELIAEPSTIIARASTYDNLDNLAPNFAERIIRKYQNTRLGRQELHGEMLEDVEGALWQWEMIDPYRVVQAPEMSRVIIGVDPAGSARKSSDETGIVAVGMAGDHYYVLADRSGRMSPNGWARAVDAIYDELEADAIAPEANYGGDMVVANLRSAGVEKRILPVHSRRGKAIRAEPVVALYEQGRVHHVGTHEELEEQLTTWQPYEDRDSPDRLDALVHGITSLMGRNARAEVASPSQLRKEADRVAQTAQRRHLHPVPGTPFILRP